MSASAPYQVLAESRLRRVTGRRMRQSLSEQPQVTLQTRAPAQRLVTALAERGPERPSLTAALVQLTAKALRQFPRLNGRFEGDEIRLYQDVHLAVAVAVPDGLVAPVVRHADTKTTDQIGAELRDLRQRAQTAKLRPQDLEEGTFTITNLGAFGVEFFTPIINPPQLGILGIGRLLHEAVVADATVQAVPMLPVSLTFDHASIDGAEAGRFLQVLSAILDRADEHLT